MIEPKMAPGEYVDWSKEIPKELWEQIIVEAENPALITTCKLFKDIIYDPATSVKNLEANFKDQFPSTFAKVKKRDYVTILKIAKMLLIERLVTSLPQEAMDCFEKVENPHYYSFTKILNDEYCFNLSNIFEQILPVQFVDKINNEASFKNKINLIYDYINKNHEIISDVKILKLNSLKLTLIPKELCLFTGLTFIDLSNNQITKIPKSFGKNWKELKICNLSGNQLTNLPNDFGNNWNLQFLNLSKNRITEFDKVFGGSWNQLKRIDLSQNEIKTVLPSFGKNWTHLESIALFFNKIDPLPSDFGSQWKELVFIRFGNNPHKLDENEFKEKTNKNVRIIQ